MAAIIFALFVGVPIAEIAIFIKAGEAIGLGATLAVVILTAIAGTALLRHQGLATLREAETSLRAGHFPVDQVFDGLCLLVAGALLLTPGFLTDTIGFLLFVPPVRRGIANALTAVLVRRGTIIVETADDTVIDGAYRDVTPPAGKAGDDAPGPGAAIPDRSGERPGGGGREP